MCIEVHSIHLYFPVIFFQLFMNVHPVVISRSTPGNYYFQIKNTKTLCTRPYHLVEYVKNLQYTDISGFGKLIFRDPNNFRGSPGRTITRTNSLDFWISAQSFLVQKRLARFVLANYNNIIHSITKRNGKQEKHP